MASKVLVAYASKTGTAAEVAQAIGEELGRAGIAADVRPAKDVRDVSGYAGVVLGTGVRMEKPYGDAVSFVSRHLKALQGVPVAYFSVGMMLMEDTSENRAKAETFLRPLTDLLAPASIGLFGGCVNYKRLGLTGMMMKMGKVAEGDWRDWDAIRTWAAGLAPAMA